MFEINFSWSISLRLQQTARLVDVVGKYGLCIDTSAQTMWCHTFSWIRRDNSWFWIGATLDSMSLNSHTKYTVSVLNQCIQRDLWTHLENWAGFSCCRSVSIKASFPETMPASSWRQVSNMSLHFLLFWLDSCSSNLLNSTLSRNTWTCQYKLLINEQLLYWL